MNLGDTNFTLKRACYDRVEAEASYAAGQLLFLQDRFIADAIDCGTSIATVKQLSKRYENTLASTLWRYVEEPFSDAPVVGIISQHPMYVDEHFDPHAPCKYCIQSQTFREEFSQISEKQLFSAIAGYCDRRRRGPIGEDEVWLRDDNGRERSFHFESFSNTYEVLTLGVHKKERLVAVAI